MMRRWLLAALLMGSTSILVVPVQGQIQFGNLPLPVDSLEHLLNHAPFELPDTLIGTRFAEDRTQRPLLIFENGPALVAKWARAPEGGEEFNNSPRYEVAAYEIQKLFLDEPEYVVPPTVMRMVPVSWYRTLDDDVDPTFDVGESVLVTLQVFLGRVSDENVFDEDRFEADSVYARYWGNANLLTYLIRHNDSNQGNLLISTIPSSPRVFAVDNGLSFRSPESNRGTRWRVLQVQRFPAHTVERLRELTEEDLHRHLGVLAQWELMEGELVPVEPGENWRDSRGIRERDDGVQIGLTENEIEDVWERIEDFLYTVDRGRMELF